MLAAALLATTLQQTQTAVGKIHCFGKGMYGLTAFAPAAGSRRQYATCSRVEQGSPFGGCKGRDVEHTLKLCLGLHAWQCLTASALCRQGSLFRHAPDPLQLDYRADHNVMLDHSLNQQPLSQMIQLHCRAVHRAMAVAPSEAQRAWLGGGGGHPLAGRIRAHFISYQFFCDPSVLVGGHMSSSDDELPPEAVPLGAAPASGRATGAAAEDPDAHAAGAEVRFA